MLRTIESCSNLCSTAPVLLVTTKVLDVTTKIRTQCQYKLRSWSPYVSFCTLQACQPDDSTWQYPRIAAAVPLQVSIIPGHKQYLSGHESKDIRNKAKGCIQQKIGPRSNHEAHDDHLSNHDMQRWREDSDRPAIPCRPGPYLN